jgi:hypothetical protein
VILRMADEKTAMVRCPSRAADGANIASYPELRAYSASIDARRSPSARARGLREEFSTASADNSENRPRAEIKPRYRDGKRGKLTFP